MKAAWFDRFGAAGDVLQVGEQPDPVPGPGEVRLRLHTSGVNPSDVKKRAGAFPDLLAQGLVIPHSDGAGVIDAVGDGVDAARVGKRVWIYQAQFARRHGSAAGMIAIDSRRAVALPDNTSAEIGACLGIPAMTAHRCVHADGPVNGQTVLVTGGAGRVGYYAIQWAHLAGATVIATASNDEDATACLDAGATATVNHREEGWSQAVLDANCGRPVDRVIDVEFGANLPEVLKLIRSGGIIATYSSAQVARPELPFMQMMYLDLSLRLVIVYSMPEIAKREAIYALDDALQNDLLQHRVADVLPLDDIARSHELIEAGRVRGCVVLDVR